MWVIRALFALIFAAAVILIDLPLHLITWLIEKASPGSCTKFRHGYARFAMKGIWLLAGGRARFAMKGIWLLAGGRATVLGLENIPEDHPVLFVGNHRSIFDIILAGSLIKYPVGFVAKKKTILTAIDYVKSGISMFIFPEGTRCKVEGTFLPFHAGSFKIATKAKVPIVPVTIVGMGDVFEDHYPRLKWAPVVIEFGKPIETADMDRNAQKDLPDKVKALMEETYKKNSELIAKK